MNSIYVPSNHCKSEMESFVTVLKKNDSFSQHEFMHSLAPNKSTLNNFKLIKAVYKNDVNQLNILLENSQPNFFHNMAINIAASAGHIHLMKILLGYPSVNISDQNDAAIKSAVMNGHIDTIKFILELYTPGKKSVYEMCYLAIKYEHIDVLKLLLDVRNDLDLRANRHYLARATLQLTDNVFFEFMLNVTDSNIVTHGKYFLSAAVKHNNYHIVKKILDMSKLKIHRALIQAVTDNNFRMVKLLLAGADSDPSENSNQALMIAVKNKVYSPIIKLLLADPRVNNLINSDILEETFNLDDMTLLKSLYMDHSDKISLKLLKDIVEYKQNDIAKHILQTSKNKIILNNLLLYSTNYYNMELFMIFLLDYDIRDNILDKSVEILTKKTIGYADGETHDMLCMLYRKIMGYFSQIL